jgi:hypothetical protein
METNIYKKYILKEIKYFFLIIIVIDLIVLNQLIYV